MPSVRLVPLVLKNSGVPAQVTKEEIRTARRENKLKVKLEAREKRKKKVPKHVKKKAIAKASGKKR